MSQPGGTSPNLVEAHWGKFGVAGLKAHFQFGLDTGVIGFALIAVTRADHQTSVSGGAQRTA